MLGAHVLNPSQVVETLWFQQPYAKALAESKYPQTVTERYEVPSTVTIPFMALGGLCHDTWVLAPLAVLGARVLKQ